MVAQKELVDFAKTSVLEAAKSSIDYTFAFPQYKYNNNLTSIRKQ